MKILTLALSLMTSSVLAQPLIYTPDPNTTERASDASAAIKLDNYLLVSDDEANVLRLYPIDGGQAIAEWALKNFDERIKKELDVEGSVLVGNTLYITGSHSNKSSGKAAQKHTGHVLAIHVSGTVPSLQFGPTQRYSTLANDLLDWDQNNRHGLGANALGLTEALADGNPPESIHGFSIEGLSVSPDAGSLWFGLRAPLIPKQEHLHAMIIPVSLEHGLAGITSGAIQPPMLLDLGGRGIRDLYRTERGTYLLLAGPSGASNWNYTHNFALYEWTGQVNDRPQLIDDNLDKHLHASRGSFETIADAQWLHGRWRVHLLMDNGDTVWEGQTQPSKKLAPAEQRFLGVRIGE